MRTGAHVCDWLLYREGDRAVGATFRCWCGQEWEMVAINPWSTLTKLWRTWHPAATSDPKFWRAVITRPAGGVR